MTQDFKFSRGETFGDISSCFDNKAKKLMIERGVKISLECVLNPGGGGPVDFSCSVCRYFWS